MQLYNAIARSQHATTPQDHSWKPHTHTPSLTHTQHTLCGCAHSRSRLSLWICMQCNKQEPTKETTLLFSILLMTTEPEQLYLPGGWSSSIEVHIEWFLMVFSKWSCAQFSDLCMRASIVVVLAGSWASSVPVSMQLVAGRWIVCYGRESIAIAQPKRSEATTAGVRWREMDTDHRSWMSWMRAQLYCKR